MVAAAFYSCPALQLVRKCTFLSVHPHFVVPLGFGSCAIVINGWWVLSWVLARAGRALSCAAGQPLPGAGRVAWDPPVGRNPGGHMLQAPVPAGSFQHRSPGFSSSGTPFAGGSATAPPLPS